MVADACHLQSILRRIHCLDGAERIFGGLDLGCNAFIALHTRPHRPGWKCTASGAGRPRGVLAGEVFRQDPACTTRITACDDANALTRQCDIGIQRDQPRIVPHRDASAEDVAERDAIEAQLPRQSRHVIRDCHAAHDQRNQAHALCRQRIALRRGERYVSGGEMHRAGAQRTQSGTRADRLVIDPCTARPREAREPACVDGIWKCGACPLHSERVGARDARSAGVVTRSARAAGHGEQCKKCEPAECGCFHKLSFQQSVPV